MKKETQDAAGSSRLRLRFEFVRNLLAKLINRTLPEKLYDNSQEDKEEDVFIQVFKSGEININAQGHTFVFSLPVKLILRKDLLLTEAEAECAMLIAFKSSITFQEDWRINSKTELIEYKWLEKPKFKIGFINLPLENIILNFIHNRSTFLCSTIDQKIKTELKLGTMVHDALQQLPNPVPISREHFVYWKATPVDSFIAPFRNEGEKIMGTLELQSQLAVGIGSKIPLVPLVVHGPVPKEISATGSSLALPVSLAYETLDFLLNRDYANQEISVSRFTINLSAFHSGKSGHQLFIKANISGSFDGETTVHFVPRYDAVQKEIVLDDINIDIKGSDFKSKLAAGLFRNLIEKTVERNNRYPVNELLKEINKQTKKIDLYEGLFLHVKINELDLEGFTFDESQLHVRLIADGDMLFENWREAGV